MSLASVAATPTVQNVPADGSPPVIIMLRLEALAVLAASLAAFAHLGASWWWYAA